MNSHRSSVLGTVLVLSGCAVISGHSRDATRNGSQDGPKQIEMDKAPPRMVLPPILPSLPPLSAEALQKLTVRDRMQLALFQAREEASWYSAMRHSDGLNNWLSCEKLQWTKELRERRSRQTVEIKIFVSKFEGYMSRPANHETPEDIVEWDEKGLLEWEQTYSKLRSARISLVSDFYKIVLRTSPPVFE